MEDQQEYCSIYTVKKNSEQLIRRWISLAHSPELRQIFGPGALKEMTGMQEKLKEEEEINGGSCMGHLKM